MSLGMFVTTLGLDKSLQANGEREKLSQTAMQFKIVFAVKSFKGNFIRTCKSYDMGMTCFFSLI